MSLRKRVCFAGEINAILVPTRKIINLAAMVNLSQHGLYTVAFHDSFLRSEHQDK